MRSLPQTHAQQTSLAGELISIKRAADCYPTGPVSASTIRRWMLDGLRGVQLASTGLAGRRLTTWRAIEKFLLATGDDTPEARKLLRQWRENVEGGPRQKRA